MRRAFLAYLLLVGALVLGHTAPFLHAQAATRTAAGIGGINTQPGALFIPDWEGLPDGEHGPGRPPPIPERTPEPDADAGVLSGEVPRTGSGRLEVLAGDVAAPNPEAEQVHTVRIEVEDNLDIDAEAFGAFVMGTLNDERGWPGELDVSFARTDGPADFRVVLATGPTVDRVCAPLPTGGYYSCATASGEAMLNVERWIYATEVFLDAGADVTEYRHYLVNHEVGHLLGHLHVPCTGEGDPAPIMLQQSIRLDGCTPNGWVVTD